MGEISGSQTRQGQAKQDQAGQDTRGYIQQQTAWHRTENTRRIEEIRRVKKESRWGK